ncbi:MAG: hypothetical protein WD030_03040, partial [Pirellulales bacterium]
NIDASGTTGGGEVLVGGDLRGGNPEIANALSAKIDAASQVNVDSIESGNAGRAIYYAEEATEYYGHTSAAARGATGDGGFIEVSGRDLVFNGSVDLSSAAGEVGSVLLDPAVFNANASNIVALRNAWGSGHLVIEADNQINIKEDLYPAISGSEIIAGSSNSLTLREETGAGVDGAVNILIDATVRNGTNTGSVGSQSYQAGNGNFAISSNGSIQGRSVVEIRSATIDLQGPINNNNSRYFTATNNADIGIGTDAVGTWHLDDDELAHITTNSHFNRFLGNGDIDVNMTTANPFLGSVQLYTPSFDVTLNEFHGRNLDVYAKNLSILGPVTGSGTFYYQQGSGRTLGIGDNAIGDVLLDQDSIDRLSGFSQFSVGQNSSSGTALDVHDADLSAFTSTDLRGSEITIDGLTVNQNLYLSHNGLTIVSPVTKTSNGGTLQLNNNYATNVGVGAGTSGDIIYEQGTLSNLGAYSSIYIYSGGNMNVNADLSAFTGNTQLNAREIYIANLQLGGSQLYLYADDLHVTGPVTGTGNTSLYLYPSRSTSSSYTLGDGPAADWELDQDELDQFSGFGYLSAYFYSSNSSLYVNADLTGMLSSNAAVSLRAFDMTVESLTVPNNLELYANTMDILAAPAAGVTTQGSNAQITISPYSSSNSLGLGDTATGVLKLTQADLDQLHGFGRYYFYTSNDIDIRNVSLPGSLQVRQNNSNNTLTIDGLTLTDPTDALTLFSSGEIVGQNIAAGGNVNVQGNNGIRGFGGNRFGIDRQFGTGYTQFTSNAGDIFVALDNAEATAYTNASTTDGSIDIVADGSIRFGNINARNPSMNPQIATVKLGTTDDGDIELSSNVQSASDITIDSAGGITETTGAPLLAPGEISLFAVRDITGNGSGGYFDVRPDSKINAATSGPGSNIWLQTYYSGDLVLGDISTNDGTLYARALGNYYVYDSMTNTYTYYNSNVDALGTINTGGAEIVSQYGDVLITTLNASGDVLIQAGEDITVRANTITLTDGANITMRSIGDIHLNGSVQNASVAGGDVNLIAGWDGTTGLATPFDMTPFLAADVATTTIYGRNEGSIFIGDGTQTEGIAVGSRNGTTHAFAYDLNLTGGISTTSPAFAQLGFQVNSAGAAFEVTGPIYVHARNNIAASAGDSPYSYAQIGHVGADLFLTDVAATVDAAISIVAGGDIRVEAGSDALGDSAYALVGHGGALVHGDFGGNITIEGAESLVLAGGGAGGNFAKVGNGSYNGSGSSDGNITIRNIADIELLAGIGAISYAQIGNGGALFDGEHGGNISLESVTNLTLHANGDGAYAQVGNGGVVTSGNMTGDVFIDLPGDLVIHGGDGQYAYSQIGHGDGLFDDANTTVATGTRMGDIDIRVAGETSLVNGTQPDTRWLIGHRSATPNAISNADVTLITGTLDYDADNPSSQVTLNQDFADKMEANLAGGHVTIGATNGTPGASGGMVVDGAFLYDSPNHLSFLSTTDVRFNASVQNSNATGGDVNLVAGWDGMSGVVNPLDSLDFGPFAPTDFLTEDVEDTDLFGNDDGSIFIGDGTQASGVAVGSAFGGTNAFGHDLVLRGSDTASAYAQLGFQHTTGGRPDSNGYYAAGDIQVGLTGQLTALAGRGSTAYVQLGHGGNQASAGGNFNYRGSITIASNEDISFAGGDGFRAYAQLGHGGVFALGSHQGDISIATGGDLILLASSATDSYVQLGHGGHYADGNHSGDIDVVVAGDLRITGGGGHAYAQLGHGGHEADGSMAGDIDLLVSGSLTLLGRNASDSYALIGHGDEPGDGDAGHQVSGNVTLSVGEGASLTNAFIGHLIDPNGTYTSGNTHIAVGTANYAGSNTTDALISDSRSQITSAPDGELRLYLPRRSSFQMADGATLNGTDVNTFNDFTPFPNEQGGHQPFEGGYIAANDPDGNFAFYYSLIELWVQAGSGSTVYGEPTTDPGWIVTNEVLSEAELASLGL